MSVNKINLLKQLIPSTKKSIAAAQELLESYKKQLQEAEEAAEKAKRITTDDIVPGAAFYQYRPRADKTAKKTVVQLGGWGSQCFALMGVDFDEFRLGSEEYKGTIPFRASKADIAAWLSTNKWTKDRQQ